MWVSIIHNIFAVKRDRYMDKTFLLYRVTSTAVKVKVSGYSKLRPARHWAISLCLYGFFPGIHCQSIRCRNGDEPRDPKRFDCNENKEA